MLTTSRVSHLSDPRQFAQHINKALQRTDALGLSSDQTTVTVDRNIDVTGNLNVSGAYKIASVQVVGPRITGWAADTGTAEPTAHATYTAGTTLTYSATYVQSEQTAMATRMAAVEAALQSVTRGQKAIKDALLTHGLIGT
jgi:hypothetical protein